MKVLTTLQQRGQNHHIKAIPKSSNNTKITMMAAIPLDCGRKNKQKKSKFKVKYQMLFFLLRKHTLGRKKK